MDIDPPPNGQSTDPGGVDPMDLDPPHICCPEIKMLDKSNMTTELMDDQVIHSK